jgi:hypothetical protein
MANLEKEQEKYRLKKEEEEEKREQDRDEKMALLQSKLEAQEQAYVDREKEIGGSKRSIPQQMQSFLASGPIMLMINYTHPLSATMRHVYIDLGRILRAGTKDFPMTVTLEGPCIMFGEGKCLALGKDPL